MAEATNRPALLAVEVVIRQLITNGVLAAAPLAAELERSAKYTDDDGALLYMLARIARASRPSRMRKLTAFRAKGELVVDGGKKYFPNEYCTLTDESNPKKTALTKVDATGTKLIPIPRFTKLLRHLIKFVETTKN